MWNIENNTKMQCFHINNDLLSYEFQLGAQAMSPTLQRTNTSPKWSTTTISKWVSVATQLQKTTQIELLLEEGLFLAAQLTRKSSSFELSELPWCVCVRMCVKNLYVLSNISVSAERSGDRIKSTVHTMAGKLSGVHCCAKTSPSSTLLLPLPFLLHRSQENESRPSWWMSHYIIWCWCETVHCLYEFDIPYIKVVYMNKYR